MDKQTRAVTMGTKEYYVTKEANGTYSIAGRGQNLPKNTEFGRSTIDKAWEQGKPTWQQK